jgi:hypothetical protein
MGADCSFSLYNFLMQRTFDRFILEIPLLFIKQFPYAWIATVALWSWPPNFSLIFLAIIVVGLLSQKWQYAAWISNLRREHALKDGTFYMDEPPIPVQKAIRNIAILCAVSAGGAFLLKGQFGLSFWQIFLLVAGFTLLYKDQVFFGAPTTYVITNSGIAIHFIPGHIDYRVFIPFRDIRRMERTTYKESHDLALFARTGDVKDGLLLTPRDPRGFTKRIERLFIAPNDIGKFLEQLPERYKYLIA